MSQSKYQANFGVIFWDKKSQAVRIPKYSSTALCDVVTGFAIEFVTFAIKFVPLANEFVTLAIEFIPWAIEFVALTRKFVMMNRLQETSHPSLDESFSPWRASLEIQGGNWSW